jgi:osmoprotectant transport system permease protein
MARALAALAVVVTVLVSSASSSRADVERRELVRVGAKNFTEGSLLGEIIAQTLEATTPLRVERRFQLGGTQVAFEALRDGAIDVYPEYSGTALLTLLREEGPAAPERLDAHLRARFGLAWLPGFGFENTYALAVRDGDKRFASIRTISELAALRSSALSLGVTHEFMDRPDGFVALARAYGLSSTSAVSMDPGILYEAISARNVDAIAAFSTDARVLAYTLRLLEDDRHFFPPYEAAPIVRLDRVAALRPALERLAGTITGDEMRAMNYEVDVRGRAAADVAADFLLKEGIVSGPASPRAPPATGPFLAYLWANRAFVGALVARHLLLTLTALVAATVAGVALGFAVARSDRLAAVVFPVVGTVQTVPSLALLGFLVPVAGIGVRPAILALFLYALLPIVRSTNAGIRSVDPRLVDVGRGIGLTDAQILRRIEVALALPTIVAGVRTSAVILVGTATLASLVGAGGLGDPIFRGLSSLRTQTILLGAIPAALLAFVVDRVLGIAERALVSPGLRRKP